MERIINEVTRKLNREFIIFFSSPHTDITSAESYFGSRIAEATLELMQAYYEHVDQEVREDKAGRKQAGLKVERLEDKREVLTLRNTSLTAVWKNGKIFLQLPRRGEAGAACHLQYLF